MSNTFPYDQVESCRIPLVRGCDLGHAFSCNRLAEEYGNGRLPQDWSRAAAFHERACALGWSVDCVQLAALYDEGKGVTPDVRRADMLIVRACTLSPRAYSVCKRRSRP